MTNKPQTQIIKPAIKQLIKRKDLPNPGRFDNIESIVNKVTNKIPCTEKEIKSIKKYIQTNEPTLVGFRKRTEHSDYMQDERNYFKVHLMLLKNQKYISYDRYVGFVSTLKNTRLFDGSYTDKEISGEEHLILPEKMGEYIFTKKDFTMQYLWNFKSKQEGVYEGLTVLDSRWFDLIKLETYDRSLKYEMSKNYRKYILQRFDKEELRKQKINIK